MCMYDIVCVHYSILRSSKLNNIFKYMYRYTIHLQLVLKTASNILFICKFVNYFCVMLDLYLEYCYLLKIFIYT